MKFLACYIYLMKKLCLLVVCFLLVNEHLCYAQITLNAAVDTTNNFNNREVIHTLTGYLSARMQNKNGKSFWMPSEAESLKTFDLYDSHSLYAIPHDQVIVLGITQPEPGFFRAKVLFSYLGTDKVRTIWAVNDYYLSKQGGNLKLSNALYANMRLNHYLSVNSALINYHFPAGYNYKQAKIDSANRFLRRLEKLFNKKINGKIEYVTAPTCENIYAVLGSSFQAGTLSSTTTFCGYFDAPNQLIITSGDEYYKHELLRILNVFYPNAPDLLQSGITSLFGGSVNKPIIYHLKKLHPYFLKHPEVLDKPDDFYYFDDETNPAFVLQAIIINYVLQHNGKTGLLKLMETLSTKATMGSFLKDQYQITNTREFFMDEFKHYGAAKNLEFEDLFKIKVD